MTWANKLTKFKMLHNSLKATAISWLRKWATEFLDNNILHWHAKQTLRQAIVGFGSPFAAQGIVTDCPGCRW